MSASEVRAVVSPKRLTVVEKKNRDQKYKVDLKKFGEHLKSLSQAFYAILQLNTELAKIPKGALLSFTTDSSGSTVTFNRKDLRSAQAKFSNQLLDLKNYLRVSKKKSRDPVKPSSLSGTYTPVYAGDALREFFNHASSKFGPVSPMGNGDKPNDLLMNHLPMVKQGFLLRNTCTILFYIYAHNNGLQLSNAQFAHSDEVMVRAFGGTIPAAFYSYIGENGKNLKVPMNKAVSMGLISAPVNTYNAVAAKVNAGLQVKLPKIEQQIAEKRAELAAQGQSTDKELTALLKKKEKLVGFNANEFNTYYYQNIAAANYYSKDALSGNPALVEQAKGLAREDVRQHMLKEHELVKQVSEEWHLLLEPTRKLGRDARKKASDAAKRAEKDATKTK